jgi:Asp-tRNA(Asn)/Glu-tRNA(Gln) amidotransferase A subunit family amidase
VAGARIVEIEADDIEAFVDAGTKIFKYEFASEYRSLIERHPERVGETARSFFVIAEKVGQPIYREAMGLRERFKQDFLDRMSDVDVLMVPTSPGLAPRLSDEMTRVGEEWVSFGFAGHRFRRWANMLDMPALAIPFGCGEDLPASIQLAALPGADAPLLDIAAMLANNLAMQGGV